MSRSRVVEATSRNGSVTAGCRDASRTSPSRRIRARRRWADAGSSSMSSRNSVPAPAASNRRVGADRFEIPRQRPPGDGPEQPADPCRPARRSPQSMATRGERSACARAAIPQSTVGRQPGSATTSTGRPPASRREVERAARRRRGVRDAEQRQRHLGLAAGRTADRRDRGHITCLPHKGSVTDTGSFAL